MSDDTKHSTEPQSRERWLDGMAVIFSGTCMVHCLVLPLLVTVFPIVQGSLLDEQQFHLVMLLLILPTLGGLVLALAHIQNFRCCRSVDCQHD